MRYSRGGVQDVYLDKGTKIYMRWILIVRNLNRAQMILVFEIGFENIFERVFLRFEFLGRYKPTPLKRNLILEI